MPAKTVLVMAVLCLLTAGHAPRMREARNPDAEGGGVRITQAIKRAGEL